MKTKALILAALMGLAPHAYALTCTNKTTGMMLTIPSLNTGWADWTQCTIDAFETINSSGASSGSASSTTHHTIWVSTISGIGAPIWVSSPVSISDGQALNMYGAAGYLITQSSVNASGFFGDGSGITGIITAGLVDGAVTTPKIADGSATTSKLGADAVTSANILNGAVTTGKIIAGAVREKLQSAEAIGLGTNAPDAGFVHVGTLGLLVQGNHGTTQGIIRHQDTGASGRLRTQGSGSQPGTYCFQDNTGGTFDVCIDNDSSVSLIGISTNTPGAHFEIVTGPEDTNGYVLAVTSAVPVGGTLERGDLFRIGNDGSVTVAKSSVTANAFFGDGSNLTGLGVADGSVTTPKIAHGAVSKEAIQTNAVTRDKILTGEVTTSKVGSGAIQRDDIETGAVSTGQIQDFSITENDLANNSVWQASILNGNVTTTKLGGGAVTSTKLNAGAVTTPKLAHGSVSKESIQAGAVTSVKLGIVTGTIHTKAVHSRRLITNNDVGATSTAPDILIDAPFVSGGGRADITLRNAGSAPFSCINFLNTFGSEQDWQLCSGENNDFFIGKTPDASPADSMLWMDTDNVAVGTDARNTTTHTFHIHDSAATTSKLGVGSGDSAGCIMVGSTAEDGTCGECLWNGSNLVCTSDADCVCDGS